MEAVGCSSMLRVGAVGVGEGGSGHRWVRDSAGWAVSA